jgi:putative addiction module component (TIGR02574 family)
MAPQLKDILKLSLSERILWAETIWNSIATEKESEVLLEISAEHKKVIDRELSAYKANPLIGSSWKEVKTRIRKKK